VDCTLLVTQRACSLNVVCLHVAAQPRSIPNPRCRSRTAVAPIERLKILMQVQGNEKVYTNMWQARCSSLRMYDARYRAPNIEPRAGWTTSLFLQPATWQMNSGL
jgi:hypothetical protein